MFSLSLFKIFFAVVLTVILQRLSIDGEELTSFVHLKELMDAVGPETAMKTLRGIWVRLNVNDACIASRMTQDLARMVAIVIEVCRAFGLTVSEKKTETMCMPVPHLDVPKVEITAAGQKYS